MNKKQKEYLKFKYGKIVKISFNKEFRWRFWKILENKVFEPLIFNEKRAGRFISIQLAKFYCYLGIIILH